MEFKNGRRGQLPCTLTLTTKAGPGWAALHQQGQEKWKLFTLEWLQIHKCFFGTTSSILPVVSLFLPLLSGARAPSSEAAEPWCPAALCEVLLKGHILWEEQRSDSSCKFIYHWKDFILKATCFERVFLLWFLASSPPKGISHQHEHLSNTSLTCQFKPALIQFAFSTFIKTANEEPMCNTPTTPWDSQARAAHVSPPLCSPFHPRSSLGCFKPRCCLSPCCWPMDFFFLPSLVHIKPCSSHSADTLHEKHTHLKMTRALWSLLQYSLYILPLSCRAISTEDKCCQFNF